MRRGRLPSAAAVVGLAVLALMPAGAAASPAAPADQDGPRTLVVDDDGMGAIGSCDHRAKAYTTVVDAVRAARDGDTILLCPGVPPSDVAVDKAVTIVPPSSPVQALAAPAEATVPSGAPTGGVAAGAGGSIDFPSMQSGWRLPVLAFTVVCGLLVVRILREGPRRGDRYG